MGTTQSTLEKHGYVLQKTTENAVVATKGDDTYLIKQIKLDQTSTNPALIPEIELLMNTSHPHIVSLKNSFKDEDQNVYYIVMDICQGGNLAAKIREMSDSPQESEVLSWIAEICVALKTIHEKGILHKCLTPENVLLTEIGTVCLGGFGNIHENSTKTPVSTNSQQTINYLPPEAFTEGTYDAKSDIWSVGCILYELYTREPAFFAETTLQLIPKIISGHYPSRPENFSSELWGILKEIFSKDPQSRPTANEILKRPIMIHCLSEKCKTTVKELQTMVDKLRDVADSLERVHQGATIGSLTGGVIGAVGGITSVVGLILAPFTLGASLIVTGVGIGVGAAGGVAAGASSITNMVNQSSDCKAVRSIIKKIEQKVNSVVCWQQEISYILEEIMSRCDSADTTSNEVSELNQGNLVAGCMRTGKGLGGIAELVRLVQVTNIGKVAAQGARAVRVAEVASGVLSGLLLAVDIFFIAMDAKEIHHIRQAKAAREREGTPSGPVSKTDTIDSDLAELVSDRSKVQDQTSTIRSEIMKFAHSIRQAADDLQKNVEELRCINVMFPSPEELNQLRERSH
ncbi:uncharacterized protein LOC117260752 [Epinephelus lanceolatus]|uniref:serine/threonine-protein kinase Nek11-like n=1 Tax=Epinephelus lanceolatus TaxID=310571 RepID=UPI001445A5EF|nr:serine/threonine-protein kinase Nek11-like [Epinephelus lanceolatus]